MAQLVSTLKQQFFDANGDPLVGGKLFSYAAGTSTPLATFTDASGLTPNTNPVILDLNGEADIWVGTSGYKFILKDALDVVQWSVDNVITVPDGSITKLKLADDVAGPGLMRNVDKSFSVNVDGTSIETDIVTSKVQIKNLGVTEPKIAAGAVSTRTLDPALDLTGLTKAVEVVFSNGGDYSPGSIKGIAQYQWSAPVKVTNPATLPASDGNGLSWSPNDEYLVVAHTTTPFVTIYQKASDVFSIVGGVTSPPGNANAASYGPDGRYVALAHFVSPYVTILKKGTPGSTFPNNTPAPFVLPTGTGTSVAWSRNSEFLAVGHNTSPYFSVLRGPLFDKISDPATLPSGTVNGVTFASDNTLFAVACTVTPFVLIYTLLGASAATLTKLPNPATLPAGSGNAIAWSRTGEFLAVAHDTAPYITIYQKSGTTFTKLADPAILPTGNGRSVTWSPNGQYLAVGHNTTPFLTIYQRSGTTFTKLANPASLPPNTVTGVRFSHNNQYLATTHFTSPFVTIYKTSSTLPSNAVLFVKEIQSV